MGTTFTQFAAHYFDGELGGLAENDTFRTALNTILTQAEGDISAIEEDVSTLQGDVSDAEGDISDIQGDVSTLQGNVSDLQSADTALGTRTTALEKRTGYPELDLIDGGAFTVDGGDVVLVGRNLLQAKTFDTITLTESAVTTDLFALTPGDSGITVQVIAGEGALGVTYNTGTKALVITLAAGGSTADAVATAVNADASEANGYVRATVTGAGTYTLAIAQAPMTGGTGDWAGSYVQCSGATCLPANETGTTSTAKWSDTQITATVPALTGLSPARVATDIVPICVHSNGFVSQPISVVLGAGE